MAFRGKFWRECPAADGDNTKEDELRHRRHIGTLHRMPAIPQDSK
eukprot:CAMPEP_0206500562 /NCGR_PEP_ID=MMETSP0324_2-20121206/52616_1 /ASSEMBLY_ACC=CAM_ASM_000836 /TAXON_ID=2866 /ORGANISM="Crypthecodinium cohnii, Strain Seligo" /LENGTH=44 /DNA_ID= /DNA_START= /DNA_END= /DNA_ORIENTATION=